MVRKSLLVLLFFSLCGIISAQNNDGKKFLGKWKGSYDANNQTFDAVLTFTEKEGKITGGAESTENLNGGVMPMENLEFKGNVVRFQVLSAISYEGIYNEEKGVIDGVLIGMNGNSLKLDFKKEANAVNNKAFEGTWDASVDENGAEAIVQIVLTDKEGKLSGTIAKPESNMGPIDLEKLMIEGKKISFQIMDGVVTFTGTISDDSKKIVGVGAENGKEVSLTFIKKEKDQVKK